MPIVIPIDPKIVEGGSGLSALPRYLMLRPLGFPSAGAEVKIGYAKDPSGPMSRAKVTRGIIVYEEPSGRIERTVTRGLTEDDPYADVACLFSVYRMFARNLPMEDVRRTEAMMIALLLDLFWQREERYLRPLFVPDPVP